MRRSMQEIKPVSHSLLRAAEIHLTGMLVRLVPASVGTKALTFLSLLSSILVFLSYYFAAQNRLLLFSSSFFILTQWAFDCLDGTVGRLRKEGFVAWGFYMDHLFDYFFMLSIVIGLYFFFRALASEFMVLVALLSSFMVASFLFHDAYHERDFRISFLGFSPIEFRLIALIINLLLFIFPHGMDFIVTNFLPYFDALLFIFLVIFVCMNQKKLEDLDVLQKRRR